MTMSGSNSVVDLLVSSYVRLRNAWVEAHRIEDCAPDAPFHQWRDLGEDAPVTARDVLMGYGETAGSLAGRAVQQHLGLLARAYWLDPAEPDGPESGRWPHAAAFGPARAALESAALVCWLLDPEPDPDERVIRAAQLGLWSQPTAWEHRIRASGLDVRRTTDGTRYLWTQEPSRPLSQSTIIRAVFGRRGADLYGRWSKLLHNDPPATAGRATLRVEGEGLYIGSVLREDEHIELAADLAEVLAVAGRRQAEYFGRTGEPLLSACAEVTSYMREVLPAIAEQVTARNSYR